MEKSILPSGIWAIRFIAGIWAGFWPLICLTLNLISPAVVLNTPEIVRKRVDLPSPFDPTIDTNSPLFTFKLISTSTVISFF